VKKPSLVVFLLIVVIPKRTSARRSKIAKRGENCGITQEVKLVEGVKIEDALPCSIITSLDELEYLGDIGKIVNYNFLYHKKLH